MYLCHTPVTVIAYTTVAAIPGTEKIPGKKIINSEAIVKDSLLPDPTLYGKSEEQGIIAVHPIASGGSSSVAEVLVYSRSGEDGGVSQKRERVYPFFFLTDQEYLRGFSVDRFKIKDLAGQNAYRNLVIFNSWNAYWDAIRHIEKKAPDATIPPLYRLNNPVQQYLMQTGKTCFLGMAFDQIHRMQLDIEVVSEKGFPAAHRPNDAIIIVALSDNRGWSQLLHTLHQTEAELLHQLVQIIQEKDPDVIEGHNIFAFDFPYIQARCKRHRVPFTIGRDGSVPRSFPSSMRFAERSIDFPVLEIAGRHVIDTYFQVMTYDIFKRDLPGYGLKTVARYFGFAPEGRTYVDGDAITATWKTHPERILDYALDDVIETERIARHLSGSTFYLTQMVPMDYGTTARTGPAAKIESLLVREYVRQSHSLPASQWGSQTLGGYTDVFFTGVAGPIVYADVESLYPSVMLHYDVRPQQDTLKVFPALLRRLTDLRLRTKSKMNEATDKEIYSELDARQNSFKTLINSFYGNLGFSHALFNDFSEADRVAQIGQDILHSLIKAIQTKGGTVVEVDTDGVLFVPPASCSGEKAERAFVASLTEALPEGIRVGFDGRFAKMLSYKKKNYALLDYNGDLKFKGSSLVSRSIERFGRQFVRDATRLLLDNDIDALHTLYLDTRKGILNHEWEEARLFCRTETLKESLDKYLDDVKSGKRSRSAAYQLALQKQEQGEAIRKGDRISYYLIGTDPNVTAFEHARPAEAWNPASPDENTAYYLKRLDEFAKKFEPFFEDHHFRLIFSEEDMFGFSSEGITPLMHG